jgi:hypothetical protein
MKCRLCNLEKHLIKAHIFPDFLYKNLNLYVPDKKGQGRVHKAIKKENKFEYNDKGLPTGIYDSNILCLECDNYLNQEFENYSKRILFDEIFEQLVGQNDFKIFTQIDYTKFKLFILSIFWKASISEHFKGINLSLAVEEEIRLMLNKKDAKEQEDFGTVLFYLNEPEITSEFLSDIKTIKNQNKTSYAFIAGGILFYFYPVQENIPNSHKEMLISKNGSLKILIYPQEHSVKIIKEFYDIS